MPDQIRRTGEQAQVGDRVSRVGGDGFKVLMGWERVNMDETG
jgi:hypothetical protein